MLIFDTTVRESEKDTLRKIRNINESHLKISENRKNWIEGNLELRFYYQFNMLR